MPSPMSDADGGSHDPLVLLTEGAVFAGVRVEPGDGDARTVYAETPAEVAGDDARRLDDQFSGEGGGDLAQRNVDGDGDSAQ